MADASTEYTAAELLAGLRHDLLSSLYLLVGAGDLLQDLAAEQDPPLSDDMRALVDIVAHASHSALDLVQGYTTPEQAG
ncbi:MAG: hypothetical protein JW910_15650 [Anaerolineae bacterium]|nr:hypothetical protein [Anaerolineae bacterium]